MSRLAALAAVLVALLAASPASAQTPFQIGTGERPNVTLDAAGTAYVAWTVPAPRADLCFCRLPRGAGACAPQTELTAPGDSLSIPLAIGSGTTVQLLSYRYNLPGTPFAAVHLFTSTDGGASFDGGAQVGGIAPHDFALGPGAAASLITSADACGTCYQRVPLDGGPGGGPAVLSSTHPYLGTVAMLDPNTPLAVFTDGSANAQFRRYGGAGDVNDAASWTPAADVGVVDNPILATGPSGTVLVGNSQLSGGNVQARRFDGNRFGSPVAVTAGVRMRDVVQDPAGRLHAVAPKFHPGPTSAALLYASSDDGASWDTRDIVFPQLPDQMRLAMAADHLGVMVGTFAVGGTTVFAYPIGPTAAQPSIAKSVQVSVVSGTVLIRVPGARGFSRLTGTDVIPVGSIVDTTKGRVRIAAATRAGGLQTADFSEGVFRVTQARSELTTLALVGGLGRCPRSSSASAAAKAKVLRKLWASGAGQFRTKGKYATATLRGTTWYTADRCDGTLVRVTQGRVVVRDLERRRSITLRAGTSYLARA